MDPLDLDPRTIKRGCLGLGAVPVLLVLVLWLFGVFGRDQIDAGPSAAELRRLANRESRHILDAVLRLGEWSPTAPRTAEELEQALLREEAQYDQQLRASPGRAPKPTFLQSYYVLPRRDRTKTEERQRIERELAQKRQRLRQLLDPWEKNRYRIRIDLDIGPARRDLPHVGLVYVTSAGPDLQFGTSDDLEAFDRPPWISEPPVTATADKYFDFPPPPSESPEPPPATSPAPPATPAAGEKAGVNE